MPAGKGLAVRARSTIRSFARGRSPPRATASINLDNGLVLSGNGSVNLGGGSLTVNDPASGISGGGFRRAVNTSARAARRQFTHVGGTVSAGNLYLGYNAADSGTYNLAGTRQTDRPPTSTSAIPARERFSPIGREQYRHRLYLGIQLRRSGTYNLGGTGQLTTRAQYVGYSGTGTSSSRAGPMRFRSAAGLYLGSNAPAAAAPTTERQRSIVRVAGRIRGHFRRWKLHPVGRDQHHFGFAASVRTPPVTARTD